MLEARSGVGVGAREVAACREDPEERLAALARGPAALRRALARVAGRLVETKGWERLGFARLADYAEERAGISARELRDLAAVSRALAGLRGLESAYLAGRIGWTQLRLLCRVAEPDDQQRWLALAEGLSAGELAREVRRIDQQARAPLELEEEPGGFREGVVLRISNTARGSWWKARNLASQATGHRLSHSEFAEVLTAEVQSTLALEAETNERDALALGRAAAEPSGMLCGRSQPTPTPPPWPPPAEVEVLVAGLESADAFALDERLRGGVRMEARHLARLATRLAEGVALGLHREVGFNSLDAYVEERLGMARSKARGLLRVERACQGCPALRAAFADGRISWVQAHALISLWHEPEAGPHREAWIAHAQRVSVRRLRADLERAAALGEVAPPSPGGPDRRDPAGLQTGAVPRWHQESARLFFNAPPEVARLFRALLAALQRRIERIHGRPATRSEALEAMLADAVAAWHSEHPPGREYAVFERDGWRCTVPGCTSQRNLHKHHVVFRSRGGGDDDSNLTTLCAWHHLRGVHGGVVRCTGTAPDGLRFELGLRTGRRPLLAYGPGEALVM